MLKEYLKSIKKYKALSSEEEIELAQKVQQGDKKAENKLICANLLYVISVALKFKNQKYLSIEELISAGNVGIIEAAKRFNPEYKFKFITYAKHWILQQIYEAIHEHRYLYHVPPEHTKNISRYKSIIDKCILELKEIPKDEELVKMLGIKKETLLVLYEIELGNQSVSLDSPIRQDNNNSFSDIIKDDSIDTEREYIEKSRTKLIEDILDNFSLEEKEVIKFFYGINRDYLPISEISIKLNMSKAKVKTIRDKAIRKLRCHKLIRKLKEYN